MTLFDIDKAIENFEFDIDEETGEVLNPYGLDDLKMERNRKIENIAMYIKNLEAEAEAIKKEKGNMDSRQKATENKAKRLREYLVYALQGEKFSTPRVAVTYRKSESVEIPDDKAIDDKYCNIVVTKKPDKTVIKKALKEGKEIAGASLVTKNNIQVR